MEHSVLSVKYTSITLESVLIELFDGGRELSTPSSLDSTAAHTSSGVYILRSLGFNCSYVFLKGQTFQSFFRHIQ